MIFHKKVDWEISTFVDYGQASVTYKITEIFVTKNDIIRMIFLCSTNKLMYKMHSVVDLRNQLVDKLRTVFWFSSQALNGLKIEMCDRFSIIMKHNLDSSYDQFIYELDDYVRWVNYDKITT